MVGIPGECPIKKTVPPMLLNGYYIKGCRGLHGTEGHSRLSNRESSASGVAWKNCSEQAKPLPSGTLRVAQPSHHCVALQSRLSLTAHFNRDFLT